MFNLKGINILHITMSIELNVASSHKIVLETQLKETIVFSS